MLSTTFAGIYSLPLIKNSVINFVTFQSQSFPSSTVGSLQCSLQQPPPQREPPRRRVLLFRCTLVHQLLLEGGREQDVDDTGGDPGDGQHGGEHLRVDPAGGEDVSVDLSQLEDEHEHRKEVENPGSVKAGGLAPHGEEPCA